MRASAVSSPPPVPITAIVTAYRRIEQTLSTLAKLSTCTPGPDEILVHVDGGETECEKAIRSAHPEIRILSSTTSVGPGGGRNKLIAAARNELVASFDDDSFPLDADYFARVRSLAEQFPQASIFTGSVYHRGEQVGLDSRVAEWVSDFCGGACVYRRSDFLATSGYVPLPVAYGMEEVDLALRLHARGGRILRTPWLRVFHDTNLQRHAASAVTAGSIKNLALLAYLRYPASCWWIGFVQCFNRVLWLVRNGRLRGICSGVATIPFHLLSNRYHKHRLASQTVRSYLRLRRSPIPASFLS